MLSTSEQIMPDRTE